MMSGPFVCGALRRRRRESPPRGYDFRPERPRLLLVVVTYNYNTSRVVVVVTTAAAAARLFTHSVPVTPAVAGG